VQKIVIKIIGSRIIFLILFFTTFGVAWQYHLKMILPYRTGQYSHLVTLNSKIHPLFYIFDTETGWCEKSKKQQQELQEWKALL